MRIFKIFTLSLALLFSFRVMAGGGEKAGYVISFQCPGKYSPESGIELPMYRLNARNKKEHISRLMPLTPGDRLEIKPGSGCGMDIRIAGRREQMDDRKNIFYEVKERQKPSIWQIVFTCLFPDRPSVTTGGTRNYDVDELIIPVFAALPAEKFIIAGKPGLFLRWKGGEAPYTVRIYRADDDTLLYQGEEILETQTYLAFDRPLFESGQSYWLEVESGFFCRYALKDERMCRDEGEFQAVAAERQPIPPDELRGYTDNDRDMLFAVWLLNEHRQWMLEAYQNIARVKESYDERRDVLSHELSTEIIRQGFE
ncbi:MAG: hypothetical protein GY862_28225 [Gammaproteobacteria bacterium]|nr:hypothetical protein [Gammaproteobacteria bacterium]